MYDLMILSLNQQKNSKLHFEEININALNKNGKKTKKYYYEIWPFINNTYGILYKIFTPKNLGEFECCDDIFNFIIDDDNSKTTLQELLPTSPKEFFDDCLVIDLKTKYENEFTKLIEELLSSSPISTIAFLCRGQSFDKEIVLGTFQSDDFMKMLHSGKIRTNVCYLITKTGRQGDGSLS